MEKIQQALQQLQRALKSASADRHDEAAQLARDLYSLCLERGSVTELGKHIRTLSTVVLKQYSFLPPQSLLRFRLILAMCVAYTTSVLFSSENGVLQFLRAATNMDEVCVHVCMYNTCIYNSYVFVYAYIHG